ncbi:hypothetical protein PR048_011181 [Dryococelus australis]|uniref:Integrase catalytic domain-containing protein n=1 Tax=Dryococelus australis TaxID=614101 RepID=A0ABQ9HKU9_9NEOP|nr:hypothetical protein PR048_011181 [Dryococelus australis]
MTEITTVVMSKDRRIKGRSKPLATHVNKTTHQPGGTVVLHTQTPSAFWEKYSLDVVGPLTKTEDGNNLMKGQTTESIAKAFVKNVILKYGIPQVLLSDQGLNLNGKLFQRICRLLKIEKIKTTAYHPQSNGSLQRYHKVLGKYLQHFISRNQLD